MLKNLRQLLGVIHRIQLGAADHSHLILHEIVMEITVGVGGAVGSDQQICAIEIGGTQRHQLDLHREVGQFTGDIHIRRRSGMGNALAGRTGATAGKRRFLCFLRSQHSGFVVGGCLPLFKGNSIHGASRQAIAQTVAVVLPEQLCLASYNANGTLVAGIGAQTAAVALFFIDGNDSSDHGNTSNCSFLL